MRTKAKGIKTRRNSKARKRQVKFDLFFDRLARAMKSLRRNDIKLGEIGKAVAQAVGERLEPVLDTVGNNCKAVSELLVKSVPQAPANGSEPVAYLSSEQRHTKPLQPYESFVYGFGLSIPTKLEPGDAIESEETRKKLREKYQTIVRFLTGMMKEVEAEIDAYRGEVV
jgi:hypothetical protein